MVCVVSIYRSEQRSTIFFFFCLFALFPGGLGRRGFFFAHDADCRGTYVILCEDGFMKRLQLHGHKMYKEDINMIRELKIDRTHLLSMNTCCRL